MKNCNKDLESFTIRGMNTDKKYIFFFKDSKQNKSTKKNVDATRALEIVRT